MFRQALREWINDNAPRLGASIAFYTLLSLAPVIVIAVAVAAAVYGQEAAQGRLALEIRDVAGPEVAQTIQEVRMPVDVTGAMPSHRLLAGWSVDVSAAGIRIESEALARYQPFQAGETVAIAAGWPVLRNEIT